MGKTVSLLKSNIAFGEDRHGRRPPEATGDPVRADGWFGWSDGLHTVSFHVSHHFDGRIYLDGTLALKPKEEDWFPILIGNNAEAFITFPGNPGGPPGGSSAMQVKAVTFTGNFSYVRYRITNASVGSVGKILMNH